MTYPEFKNKYLKYKLKYLKLKKKLGGGSEIPPLDLSGIGQQTTEYSTPRKLSFTEALAQKEKNMGWEFTPRRVVDMVNSGIIPKPSTPEEISFYNELTSEQLNINVPEAPVRQIDIDKDNLEALINMCRKEFTLGHYKELIDKYYDVYNTTEQIDNYIFDIYNDTYKHTSKGDKKLVSGDTAAYKIRGILMELMKLNVDNEKDYKSNKGKRKYEPDEGRDYTPIADIYGVVEIPPTWDSEEDRPELNDILWDQDKTNYYSTPADGLLPYIVDNDLWNRIQKEYFKNNFDFNKLFDMYAISLEAFLCGFKYKLCEYFKLGIPLKNIDFHINMKDIGGGNYHWFLELESNSIYPAPYIKDENLSGSESLFSENGIDITFKGRAGDSMDLFMNLQDMRTIDGILFDTYIKKFELKEFEKYILILIISCGLKLFGDESYKHELFKRLILDLPLYYGTHDNNNGLEMENFMRELYNIIKYDGKLWTKQTKKRGEEKDDNYYTKFSCFKESE